MNEATKLVKREDEPGEIDRRFDDSANYRGAVYSYGPEGSEGEVHLLDYWRAIRKRLWLVLGVAALITALSSAKTSSPHQYRCRSRVISSIHPRLDGGCMGDGHHGWAAADFLSFVRTMLVRETADGGLALCSMVPDAWTGQNMEVHDAPTHHGRVSFAVRWHGDRPALLWESDADGPLRCSGLDPGWSTARRSGEALLSPIRPAPP